MVRYEWWQPLNLFNKFVHQSEHLHPVIRASIKYRYLIFLVGAISVWFDGYVYTGRSLVGLYSLIMIFLGLVFANVWQGVFNSLLVTLFRYSFSANGFPNELEFGFQWLSYFAIWFAVSTLVKNNIEQKENLIRVTTALAKSLDSRDKYTAFHSKNVSRYSELIAKEMRLTETACRDIKLGALLHDIGKIGIPEGILNKPSKLTDDEYEVIKSHTIIGYDTVKHIQLFEQNGVLDAILYHHEREDGSGYPYGLTSEEIPLIAKIVAVADSFDAMTSNRIYRKEKSFTFAVNEILNNKGKHYDPQVVDAFIKVVKRKGEDLLG